MSPPTDAKRFHRIMRKADSAGQHAVTATEAFVDADAWWTVTLTAGPGTPFIGWLIDEGFGLACATGTVLLRRSTARAVVAFAARLRLDAACEGVTSVIVMPCANPGAASAE